MDYKKWMEHQFSTGTCTGEDYKKFQTQMRNDLKKQLKEAGAELYKFIKGHYWFAAIVKKYGSYAFISISDVRHFKNNWVNNVLYRRMDDEKDLSGRGGENRYCTWDTIGKRVSKLLEPDPNDYTIEYCPFCDTEQVIFAKGITRCPGCGKPLVPCSMCDGCKNPCPYGCQGDERDEHKEVTNPDIPPELVSYLYQSL